MAGRKKKRPVMYEIIRRSQRSEAEKAARPARAPARSRREPVRAAATVVPISPRVEEPQPQPQPQAQAQLQPRPPVVRLTDRGVAIQLGWTGCTVLVIGTLCVLAVTFGAGSRYARETSTGDSDNQAGLAGESPSGADPADARRPAGTNVAVPPRSPGIDANRARGAAQPPERLEERPFDARKGYSYIIVQYFQKSKLKDARAAAVFLRLKGVACAVERGSKDIRLIATKPFLIDQKDAARRNREKRRAEDLQKQIRRIGKEYARTGGRYAFDQCPLTKF